MTILQQPDALSLSLNIKDFRIASTVAVSFVLKVGATELVAQTYEPGQDGYVTIKVRDIVHAQLSYTLQQVSNIYQQQNIVATFTAVIDTTEVTFVAIRGGVDNLADTATNFLTANFLTWQPTVKPITYSSPEFLSYFAVVACTAKLKAYFTDANGTVISDQTITLASLSPGIAYTIPLQYAIVSALLGNTLPAYYDVWVEDATAARLTYIQRYYASNMRSEQEEWVLFENSLGGLDTFRAYGSTEFSGEHTHNIAETDEVSEEYRVDTERKFQKNTGHLDNKERKWLLDFFPSLGKYIYIGSYLRKIVLTESDVTYTDKELPSNYNFTYKYADARPLLNLSRTDTPAEVLNIVIPQLGNFTVPPRLVELDRLPLTEGALFPVQSPYDEEWKATTAGAMYDFIANRLGASYTGGGGVGHTHNNIDLLQLISYVQEYLLVNGLKIKAGYADDVPNRLRKDQPDSTSFLLKLLAGIEAGEFVAGESGAKIDANGDAEVRNLIARIKATVAALEAKTVTVTDKVTTLNLLVQKLAEIYDLNVSNVATLFRTIVKDYVSSESFVPGITGEGMKLYKALNGDWNFEVDNIIIRKAMTVFELIISKVRSVNGGLVVSPANGRIKSVTETTGTPTYYVLGIEGDMTFVADDLVRCQVFSSTGAKYYWVPIDSVSGETILILKSNFPDGVVPAVGDDLVQMGNKSNTARQGVLYLTASEDGKPRFSVLDGVNSTDLTGKNKVILGCLDGITDSDFPSDAQPSGYGLWAGNVFLKGLFILRNGKSIEDELSDQITAVQTAFEIREGQISIKVTQATQAAAEASGYASSAAGSASSANQSLTTITQKESSINQTANEITLKVTRAESAAGRAESAEASINLKADGIVLQASNAAAQTAVNGVQIGGRNLLNNSNDFTNFTYSSGSYGSINNPNPFGINNATLLNLSSNMVGWDMYRGYTKLIPGLIYTISLWVKLGTATNFVLTPNDSTAWSTINKQVEITSLGWNRIKTTFTANNSGRVNIHLGANLESIHQTAGTVYVYGLKVELGNKATDWTPAPEDVTADAQSMANTAESNAKTYVNNNFTTKVEYTAKLQVLNDAINAKVSQTTYDGLNSRVSSAEAKITSDAINLTVKAQTQQIAADASKRTQVTIDATGLDSSKYYPVTIFMDPTVPYTITVQRTLASSYGVPSYSTHPNGFSVICKWTSNGDGWGIVPVSRIVHSFAYAWSNVFVVGNIGQLSYSSQEYIYVRGGSKYDILVEGTSTATVNLITTTYTWQSGTYSQTLNILDSVTAPVVTYKTESEIKAGLEIVSGGIRFFGQDFSFAGKVTIGSLDSTIIENNKIKTSLINADAIITTELLARKISATDISTSKLTVNDGARIGDLYIYGGGLCTSPQGLNPANLPYLYLNKNSFVLNAFAYSTDYHYSFNHRTELSAGKISIKCITTGTAYVTNPGLQIEVSGNSDDTAINILAGYISGFRLRTLTVRTSQTLSVSDGIIISEADSEITLTLPSTPGNGKMYFIRKNGGGRIWVNGSYIINDGDWYRERSTSVQLNRGCLAIFMYNGTYWTYNTING